MAALLTDTAIPYLSSDDLLLDFSCPLPPSSRAPSSKDCWGQLGEEVAETNQNGMISEMMSGGNGTKKMKVDDACRIGFRMKSEVEILDDGYKWRKYGKKSVKNSPNPRNYYRCSSQDCGVKKRVERDRDDPRYVVTTYEGMHNHTSPDVIQYAQPMVPGSWREMQAFGASEYMDSAIGSFQFN